MSLNNPRLAFQNSETVQEEPFFHMRVAKLGVVFHEPGVSCNYLRSKQWLNHRLGLGHMTPSPTRM